MLMQSFLPDHQLPTVVQSFAAHSYVVIEDFLSDRELDVLRQVMLVAHVLLFRQK